MWVFAFMFLGGAIGAVIDERARRARREVCRREALDAVAKGKGVLEAERALAENALETERERERVRNLDLE